MKHDRFCESVVSFGSGWGGGCDCSARLNMSAPFDPTVAWWYNSPPDEAETHSYPMGQHAEKVLLVDAVNDFRRERGACDWSGWTLDVTPFGPSV